MSHTSAMGSTSGDRAHRSESDMHGMVRTADIFSCSLGLVLLILQTWQFWLSAFASFTAGLDIACGKYGYCLFIICVDYFDFPSSEPEGGREGTPTHSNETVCW